MRTKASLIFAAICGALLLTTASAAHAAEAPYGGTAAAVPGTVQAENYDTGGQGTAYNVTSTNGSDNGYRSDGVDLEVTTDTGGGVDLGWSAAGQWFKYTVNVATAGKYTVTFRLAAESAIADGLHISNSAGTNLSGSVAVPNTGGWQTWTSVTASVTLPAGTQTLTINQDAAGWNMNWLSFAAVASGEGPYGGTAAAIPGTVMASNYDTGGQGVGYSVSSTNGSANTYRSDGVDLEAATSPATGDDLGWTAAGQWFRYTVNVSTAGTYTVSILVASPTAVADGFHISNSSGTNLSGSVAVPATGGYQTWTTVTATVTLPAGTQTLTVNQDAGGWNIDSLKFASTGGGCTTKPSAPTGLAASGTTSTGTSLNWTADSAPANCSISSYTVLKGGVSIGTATGTSFAVTGLAASTNYSFTVEATDAAGTSAASSAVSVTTSAASGGEGPYPGPSAAAIPGTVMAENYDTGGQGVAYNVTSTNGTANTYRAQGVDLEAATAPATGNDLGWSAAGQWFRYTVNVSTAGTYTASFLVASPTAVGDAFHISNSSGTNLTGSVAVPATGGYQTWVTVTANITLPAGTQTLTLSEDAAGWNIDSLGFASGGGGIISAPITAGTYTFIPQNATGLRLDDEAASTATGNPIDVYTANGTGAQNWALTSSGVTPSGYYNLSTEGAYCLTASGTASGSAVVLDPCAGSSGQAWAAVKSGSNYTFHPANNTALCLDVVSAGTASGTLVDAYTCNGTSAQIWALSTAGSGGGGTPGKTFAPFEYVGDLGDANQIPGIVSASGAKAVILAFVDPDNGGCNLIWPGASGPIPTDTVGSTSMGTAIAQMQAAGVTVAISQGGAGGQEAAAYCSSASATQAVYQQLITKYNVKWLDFDVEYGETSGQSVRRAQALAALQAAYPGLIVSYTLPLGPGGLNGGGGGGTQDIIDAKNAGLNLTIVNGMAMDFGGTNTNQASLSEQGAASLESQIQSAGLSSTVGLTFLPGTSDDSPPNYFTLANASTMVSFANSNSYISLLSFWELNRDNGGCPGSTSDQDTCSGVSQSNYEFSSIFEAF